MDNSYNEEHKLLRYRWIYDAIISGLYDKALNLSLTPFGERLLRESVFNAVNYERKDKIYRDRYFSGTN